MGNVELYITKFGEKEIIVRNFLGDMNIQEVLDSFVKISQMLSDKCVGIVTDTTEANMHIRPRELAKIVNYIRKDVNIRKQKLAVIVNTPQKTILPILAAEQLTSTKIKAFSGKDAAIEWILK